MRLDPAQFRRLSLHSAAYADDYFDPDFARALREEILRFPRWKTIRLGASSNYAFQTGITTGHIQGRFPDLVQAHRLERLLLENGAALCALVGAAPEAQAPLAIDISGFAYGEGGRLLPHTDSIHGRHLAFMLYLVPPEDGEWSEADGGEVVLRDREGRAERLAPRFNRFACFRVSDQSWHEILEIKRKTPWPRSRLALSGWIHS